MSSSSSSSCVSSSVSTGRNPKGLQNHNNTCYMISLLQSLSYLESFTSFLDSFTVRNAGPNCILRLVQNLMNELRDPKNRNEVLSPSGIVSNMLSKFPSHFQKGRHEDSSEAFDCLLDALNDDLKKKDIVSNENGEKFHHTFDHVFDGKIKCIASCGDRNCSYESVKVEGFVTVALPLLPAKQLTLITAVIDAVSCGGSVIVTEVVAVQPSASVVVTVYVPATPAVPEI